MGRSLELKAYSGKNSPEFQKHFKAVEFCIENNLSFPKETSEFFKGKIDGDDLEDIKSLYIIEHIRNGICVDMEYETKNYGEEIIINVKDIPEKVDQIIVRLR